MKQLPNNLKNLTLLLIGNDLGENTDNMKLLEEGMKYLPKNLENLKLYLR